MIYAQLQCETWKTTAAATNHRNMDSVPLLPEQTIMSMIESTEGTEEAFDEPRCVGGSLPRLDPKTIAGRLRKLSGGDWEIEKGGGRLFVVTHPPTWVLSL